MADWNFEGITYRDYNDDREYYQHQLDCFKAIQQKNEEEKEKWEKNGRKGKYAQYYLDELIFMPKDQMPFNVSYSPGAAAYERGFLEEILDQKVIKHPSLRERRERADRIKAENAAKDFLSETSTLKGLPSESNTFDVLEAKEEKSFPSSSSMSISDTALKGTDNIAQDNSISKSIHAPSSQVNSMTITASDNAFKEVVSSKGLPSESMTLRASDNPTEEDERAFWDTVRAFAQPSSSQSSLFSAGSNISIPKGATIYSSAEEARRIGLFTFKDTDNEQAFLIHTDGKGNYWLSPTYEGTPEDVQINIVSPQGIIHSMVTRRANSISGGNNKETANIIAAYNADHYGVDQAEAITVDSTTGETFRYNPFEEAEPLNDGIYNDSTDLATNPETTPSTLDDPSEESQSPNDGIFNGLNDLTITSESGLTTLAGQPVRGRYKDGQITINAALLDSDADLMSVLAEELGEHMVDRANGLENSTEDTGALIGRRLMQKLINQAGSSPDGKARLNVNIDGDQRTLQATADELRSVLGTHFTTDRIKNPLQDEAGSYMGEALRTMTWTDESEKKKERKRHEAEKDERQTKALLSKLKADVHAYDAQLQKETDPEKRAEIKTKRAILLAQILAYDAKNDLSDLKLLPTGVRPVTDKELADAELTPRMLFDKESGFFSRIYYDENADRFIVANRSTQMEANKEGRKDMGTNVQQHWSGNAKQYQLAKNIAEKMVTRYRDRVIFVGHSLGAGLASAQSAATGNDALVFNPPMMHPSQVPSDQDKNIVRFQTENDILKLTGFPNKERVSQIISTASMHYVIGNSMLPLNVDLQEVREHANKPVGSEFRGIEIPMEVFIIEERKDGVWVLKKEVDKDASAIDAHALLNAMGSTIMDYGASSKRTPEQIQKLTEMSFYKEELRRERGK